MPREPARVRQFSTESPVKEECETLARASYLLTNEHHQKQKKKTIELTDGKLRRCNMSYLDHSDVKFRPDSGTSCSSSLTWVYISKHEAVQTIKSGCPVRPSAAAQRYSRFRCLCRYAEDGQPRSGGFPLLLVAPDALSSLGSNNFDFDGGGRRIRLMEVSQRIIACHMSAILFYNSFASCPMT